MSCMMHAYMTWKKKFEWHVVLENVWLIMIQCMHNKTLRKNERKETISILNLIFSKFSCRVTLSRSFFIQLLFLPKFPSFFTFFFQYRIFSTPSFYSKQNHFFTIFIQHFKIFLKRNKIENSFFLHFSKIQFLNK